MKLSVPLPLLYWKRSWASAHIFSDCHVFAREWAGKDFHRPRIANTTRQATRHTRGLCVPCWLRYNAVAQAR